MTKGLIQSRTARRIASEWHSDTEGGINLLIFSSSGAIQEGLIAEIEANIAFEERFAGECSTLNINELRSLRNYVNYYSDHNGVRGPMKGWANLSW